MKNVKLLLLALFAMHSSAALAINSLQLGEGTGSWSYDGSDQTWVTEDADFTLKAYANATTANGGNGAYAWDTGGVQDTMQYAYLTVSAVPKSADIGDLFNLDILGADFVTSGYGAPPLEDGLSPHSIFDTYFEIYEFRFDGAITDIFDTQPGTSGTGRGYIEEFSISNIDLLDASVDGIHFDLFTWTDEDIATFGDRYALPATPDDPALVGSVSRNAPYSHDAEYNECVGDCTIVPEPGMVGLLAIGLLGMAVARRRMKV